MHPILETATRFEDLRRIRDPRLPYRFDRLFDAKGFFARRLARRRFRLLRQLDDELRRMLEDGERVDVLTWGTEYSFVDACFRGLWYSLLNRRALVLTDRRILLLQIDARLRLGDLKSQIRYEALRRVVPGRFGMLGLEVRNGDKVEITSVPRRDRTSLRQGIEARRGGITGAVTAAPAGRQNLCPHCYSPVTRFPDRCPHCGCPFKSGGRAGWLSLLFPGLGDLYLGHRSLAAAQMVGAVAVWAVLLTTLARVFAAHPDDRASLVEAGLVLAGLFFALHGPSAWITRRTGRKGLYPAPH